MLACPPWMTTKSGYFFDSSNPGGRATKLWMRRPSRPVNENSRSGCQSIDSAVFVVNDVRKVLAPLAGSIRTISDGRMALSQLANATDEELRAEVCTLV